MERRWLGVALCCLACRLAGAAALSVTSQPAGALVRWSRADSPFMSHGGTTPCSLDLPAGAGVVLEVTAPGHLPRFVPVDDGQTRLEVSLTPWRPSLVGPLSRAGPRGDDVRGDGEPAADGAGLYDAHNDNELDAHTVTWRAAGGPEQVLARWIAPLHDIDGRLAAAGRKYLPDIWSELASSPDGRWLAYSGTDDQGGFVAIRRRDGGGGREVVRYPNVVVDYACWSADGRAMWYMATAYEGPNPVRRVLHRRDLTTGADDRYIALGNGMITLTPGGAVACFAEDGVVLFDPATGTTRQIARGWRTSHGRRALQASPDGRYLACLRETEGGNEIKPKRPTLSLVDLRGGPPRDLVTTRSCFAWLPDSSGLLVDATVLDLRGNLLADLRVPLATVETAAWRGDGRSLLVVGPDAQGRRRAADLDLAGQLRLLPCPNWAALWEAVPAGADWLALAAEEPGRRFQVPTQVLRINPDGQATPLSPPQPSARRLSCSRGGRVIAWLAGLPGHAQLWVRPADGSPAAAWDGLPEDLINTHVADGGKTLVVTRSGGERLQVDLTDRSHAPAPAVKPVWLYLPSTRSANWSEAKASPDDRWLAALWGGGLELAPADEPDRARTLFRPGVQAYGPWLYLGRPLEVAP